VEADQPSVQVVVVTMPLGAGVPGTVGTFEGVVTLAGEDCAETFTGDALSYASTV
jgi:hypothetical protein